MSNKSSKFTTKDMSRRTVLQAVAAVGAVPALMMATAPASAKMAPASVAYQGSPHGSQNCANCKLFIAPSSCKSVSGVISPNGWCKIWAKA
jgi:hypothetical protein